MQSRLSGALNQYGRLALAKPRGLYTPVYASLPRHPKVQDASSALGCNRMKLVGHLVCLWTWCLESVPADGGLLTASMIATASEWPTTSANRYAEALADAGLLDRVGERYRPHDWSDYGGKIAQGLDENNERVKGKRRAYEDGTIDAVRARDGDRCRYCGRVVDWTDRRTNKGGCYDHVIPHPKGAFSVENLVVCCRGCNTKKRDRTPDQAGMALLDALNDASDEASNVHPIDETRREETILEIVTPLPPANTDARTVYRSLAESIGVHSPPIGWAEAWLKTRSLNDITAAIGKAREAGASSTKYVDRILEKPNVDRGSGSQGVRGAGTYAVPRGADVRGRGASGGSAHRVVGFDATGFRTIGAHDGDASAVGAAS